MSSTAASGSAEAISTVPPESWEACSQLSRSRDSDSGSTTSRSTTTSTSCFFCLSSPGTSSREWTSPSTRTRTYP